MEKIKTLTIFARIKFDYGQLSSDNAFHIKLRKCSKRVFISRTIP